MIEHEDDLDGDEDSVCDDVLVSTDSVHTTRSAVAVMEAAVSSATNHPNVVKTYDYKTSSAGVAGGRATLPGNVSCLSGACHTAPSLPDIIRWHGQGQAPCGGEVQRRSNLLAHTSNLVILSARPHHLFRRLVIHHMCPAS